MTPKIERVTENVGIGEGPHWDPSTQSLYFVDIIGMTIQKYTPSTKKFTKSAVLPKQVSFVIPVEGKENQFVISQERELVRIFWDGSEVIDIEKLAEVEKNSNLNRFNDGKCDPSGRLWAGTLNTKSEAPLVFPATGTLYSLDSERKVKSHVEKLRISNGMAFNQQLKKMYYIDSSKKAIDQYDFNLGNGTISNVKTIFTLSQHNIEGLPDGMTIDTDGNLWVAIFNGQQVIKIDPRKPETLLDSIKMPVKQITSLCFGGSNLDELYVTTAAFKIENEDLPPPENGAVYRITGLGAKGVAASNFKLRIE